MDNRQLVFFGTHVRILSGSDSIAEYDPLIGNAGTYTTVSSCFNVAALSSVTAGSNPVHYLSILLGI